MIELVAKLPMLGPLTIQLFKESEKVYEEFEDIINGQRKIPHLGMAAEAISGVTHTRYEYLILQLSVVKIISKLYKEHSELAVAAEVEIPGIGKKISSGEELLKCWILLNSIGHMRYTFATERVILKKCAIDQDFRSKLIDNLQPGVKKFGNNIIRNYQYDKFYKLLSLYRINETSNARKRNLFHKLYKSALLPISELSITSSSNREKLIRLRKIYDLIRLVSHISIDTFYSHSSINLDLQSVIYDLEKMVLSRRQFSHYITTLKTIGSIIASETYLHASTTALIGGYEKKGIKKLNQRNWKNDFSQVLDNIRSAGFGHPTKDWINLFRITLSQNKLAEHKIFIESQHLNASFGDESNLYATIINNDHSSTQYVDISAIKSRIKLGEAIDALNILYQWFLNRAEIGARFKLRNFKAQFPKEALNSLNDTFINSRRDYIQRLIEEFLKHGRDVVKSLIRIILKPEYSFAIPCPPDLKSTGVMLLDNKKDAYSNIDEVYRQHKQFYGDNPDKVKEIEFILSQSKTGSDDSLVISCFSSICVTDVNGKKKDEWDGFVIRLGKNENSISILECKNTRHSSEDSAFEQLNGTKKYLNKKAFRNSRRKRCSNFGACLILS